MGTENQDQLVVDSTLASNESSNMPASSPPVLDTKAEQAQIKGLLSEARKTREVLVNFENAIGKGTYEGFQMLPIAQGLAFLTAILKQNSNHIANLQERLNA